MNDTSLFDFESDFVATLRCVPMAVRFKLDACGIKLSLRQWSRFTREDRHDLLMAPCETPGEVAAYRDRLIALIAERTQQQATPLSVPPDPLWERADAVAPAVLAFADQIGARPPSEADWGRISPLQRFALIKLSRDNHDNVNFIPALREFGLAEPAEAL